MFIFYSLLNRFSYVSNKNKAVSKVIISRTHIHIFYVSCVLWRRRNIYILFSYKSDRFPDVSNQNTDFKSDYFRNAYLYVSYVLYVSWPRRNVHILFSSKSDRFPYVSNKNKAVSKLIISRTHIYMFHDGGVTFIFYSLLSLIVFLMFQTKINPFQEWLCHERIFICSMCFICLMREA